jgi:hypothetical protein
MAEVSGSNPLGFTKIVKGIAGDSEALSRWGAREEAGAGEPPCSWAVTTACRVAG